jgi:hypothetical protein
LRIAFACIVIAAPLACAQAGEITSDHRGTWVENGECQQKKRIVIGEKTVTLVEPGRQRVLTDGDEAVFKGETLINASLPSRKEEDPVLAFSAKVVKEDGDMKLVTEGLENGGGFSGTFKLCKTPLRTAVKDRPKPAPRRAAVARTTPRNVTSYAPTYAPRYVFPPGPVLGGLY